MTAGTGKLWLQAMRRRWHSSVLLTVVLLSACAAKPTEAPAPPPVLAGTGEAPVVVSYAEPDDPWQPFNRAVFGFNDVSYRYLLIPASQAYDWLTPAPPYGRRPAPVPSPLSLRLARRLRVRNTVFGQYAISRPPGRWWDAHTGGARKKPRNHHRG